jgi:hypothetical protein
MKGPFDRKTNHDGHCRKMTPMRKTLLAGCIYAVLVAGGFLARSATAEPRPDLSSASTTSKTPPSPATINRCRNEDPSRLTDKGICDDPAPIADRFSPWNPRFDESSASRPDRPGGRRASAPAGGGCAKRSPKREGPIGRNPIDWDDCTIPRCQKWEYVDCRMYGRTTCVCLCIPEPPITL